MAQQGARRAALFRPPLARPWRRADGSARHSRAGLAPASDDLAQRVLDLYAHRDPLLGQRLSEALAAQKVAAEGAMAQPTKTPGAGGPVDQMRTAAAGAARLLAAQDGPRVAALAFDGFDTHQNEGAAQGLLAQRLQGLDAAFDAFETNLGGAWRETVVVAITEFGRTARVNGTHGTDHGTGTVALLAGGAVAGGRVVGSTIAHPIISRNGLLTDSLITSK